MRRTLVRLDGVRSFTEVKIKAKAVGGDGSRERRKFFVGQATNKGEAIIL
ncbi:hypothetical protein [Limnovirga soli]|nr:hypothetical protein [Limnovirga soli]